MHILDICVPSSLSAFSNHPVTNLDQGGGPSEINTLDLEEADDTIYLDTLDTQPSSVATHPQPPTAVTTQGARFRTDPSMYTFRDSLRAACTDSRNTLQRMTRAQGGEEEEDDDDDHTNTIYLPTGRALTYNNAQDVLHIRFIPPAFRFPDGSGRLTSPLSAMFECIWSDGLSSALHRARRVAIDVSQLWPDLAGGEADLIMQDVEYLACVLQNDLDVLYLVDYCAGRCNNQGFKVAGMAGTMVGGLYRKMFGYGCGGGDDEKRAWDLESRRRPDVVHGVGKIWREVFELEKLGWGEKHPGFVFAEAFSKVVRIQQSNDVGQGGEGAVNSDLKFKGVRVLIAEDENTEGVDHSIVLNCGCGRQAASHEGVLNSKPTLVG